MSNALVISGGGSKGAFAVGVIKKLAQQFPHLHYDIVVGTSTGSLIAPLAIMKEYELLEQLYTTVTTSDIVLKDNLGNRLSNDCIFEASPLWELVKQYYTDALIQKILTGKEKIYLNTTCLQTGELVVFTNNKEAVNGKHYVVKLIQNNMQFRRAVMASACQPVFMPPVFVNKDLSGDADEYHQYVDGGVREYAGVEIAIDQGAATIFTILLSPPGTEIVASTYETIFPILERTIDIFTLDVGKNDLVIPAIYNEALLYIDAVKKKMKRLGMTTEDINNYFHIRGRENPFEEKKPLQLYTIRPLAPLGGGPGGLVFDPGTMKKMVAAGYRAAGDFIASLPPADVHWV